MPRIADAPSGKARSQGPLAAKACHFPLYITDIARGAFVVKPGSLFPALRRLEQQGWIAGEWAPSENNRRARYYKLTRSGRSQLAEEKRNWYRMTSAMNWMLESEG